MISFIITLVVLMCIGLIGYLVYTKKMEKGTMLLVGTTYTPEVQEPYRDHFFRSFDGELRHTHDYFKVKFTEDIDNISKGSIVLVDPYKEPMTGSLCLFRKDDKYRIVRCVRRHLLYWEPDLFDGSETPGIGYDLLGVVRYQNENILKEYKL